jgi:hypothetical protein
LRLQVADETGRRDAILAEIERQKRSGAWNPAPAESRPPAPRKPSSPPRN